MFDPPVPSQPFSKRYGLAPPPEIRVTHDAPTEVRVAVLDEAVKMRIDAKHIREIVCRVLRRSPDAQNWSSDNVLAEVREILLDCEWYRVYDVAGGPCRIAAACPS